MPEVATNLWHGIVGPKGIPADRLAILQKAFVQAAHSDKFREMMVANGAIPLGLGGEAFRKHLDAEYIAMRDVMKALGLAK